jgi:hypothetical protein
MVLFLEFVGSPIWYYGAVVLLAGLLAFLASRRNRNARCPILGECCRARFEKLPAPPCRSLVIDGKRCDFVKQLCTARLKSESFAKKMVGPRTDWEKAFEHCDFYLVRLKFPLRVVGWADKLESETSPRMVVGFEPWLMMKLRWCPWRDSAIDHELTHVWQEYDRQLCSRSWKPGLTRLERWTLWLHAEWEAFRLNPLWIWSFAAILSPPLIQAIWKIPEMFFYL